MWMNVLKELTNVQQMLSVLTQLDRTNVFAMKVIQEMASSVQVGKSQENIENALYGGTYI